MKTLAERPVCSGTPTPVNQVLLRCAGSRFPKGACSLDGDSRLAYTSQGIAHSTSAGPIDAALHGALQSPGKPLDSVMRAFFEPRLMHDFSQVRVHDEARSADSARALDARAYTVGRNIVFGASQYAPHTRDGRKLIAHELVHVIQQKEATGFAAQSVGSLQLSDPGDDREHEAETISAKVTEGQSVSAVNGHSGRWIGRQTSSGDGSTSLPIPSAPSAASPLPARTVKVWVHSFIPMASIRDPFGYCYSGDNRSFDKAIHASYRTHQEIEFDATTAATTINWSDTGTTHELDRATCKTVVATAKASSAGLINKIASRAGPRFNLSFVGTAKNPRASYACDIDLNLTVSVDAAARTCSVTGAHDGFPAYEVYVTANGGAGVPVYTYDPRKAGEGPKALCGGLDKTASGTVSF